jgi:kynurenine formamidase
MVDLAAQAPDVLVHRAQIQARQDVPAGNLVELNTGWTQEPLR